MTRSVPHLRVVFPEEFRGIAHVSHAARLYVTFPGEAEREMPMVTDLNLSYPLNGNPEVALHLLWTTEVTYEGDGLERIAGDRS
jgi:hypothetical protein